MKKTKSEYLDMLPAVFVPQDRQSLATLNNILSVFEQVLTGAEDNADDEGRDGKSIGSKIDRLPSYFHPYTALSDPEHDFLGWLSSWVGLVLKEDWKEEKKRKVIAKIIPLYRMRGTKKGLEEFLNIYLDGGVTVNDNVGSMQVGMNCQVGIASTIDVGDYFIVEVRLLQPQTPAQTQETAATESAPVEELMEELKAKRVLVEKILLREKPVHSRYKLEWKNVQSLQVEVCSTVGENTLVWARE